ncbi:MAG TPA: serine hydrolase domain-containing protein [Stellaceae bacterium]|nr:serine hydrolase domain-containing protein [Stellaceae bacterium]
MTQPDSGAPVDKRDGWALSRPDSEGLDGAVLCGLGPQFETWADANIHSALIVRHGKLVYERYFAGEDRAWATPLGRVSYHAGLKHDLRSITKSVTSLLVGIAVDRRWIEDLDEGVFSYFPEHSDLKTLDKERISLRHLLTMSAGLAWNESLPYSNPANSERRMIDAPDRCRFVLEQPAVRPARPTLIMGA